jgi:hypothetical protein
MATNPVLGVAARNASVAAIGTLLNGGKIEIRTGSQPANPDTAATGTLLGTLTLSATAFGSASTGTITANAITGDSSADNSGTAAWFRAYKSDGTTGVIDGTVGTSGADMNLSSTSIVAGGTINLTSWTITQPA